MSYPNFPPQGNDPSQAPRYSPNAPTHTPAGGYSGQPPAPGHSGPQQPGYGSGPGYGQQGYNQHYSAFQQGYGGGPGGNGPTGPGGPWQQQPETPWYKKPITLILLALLLIGGILAAVFLALGGDDDPNGGDPTTSLAATDEPTESSEPTATDEPTEEPETQDPTEDPTSDGAEPTEDPTEQTGGESGDPDPFAGPTGTNDAQVMSTDDTVEHNGYAYQVHGLSERENFVGDPSLCVDMTITRTDAFMSFASTPFRLILPNGEEPIQTFLYADDEDDLFIANFDDNETEKTGVLCFLTPSEPGEYKVVLDSPDFRSGVTTSYMWELTY